jgi:hypothetical protein
MLIEPASKVSVPFTVVMRTRSRVALRTIFPAIVIAAPRVVRLPEQIHVLALIKVKTIVPEYESAAELAYAKRKPVALDAPLVVLFVVLIRPEIAVYPEVTMPPDVPNLVSIMLVPLVETPLNITVIRFTPAGIDVKSMLVPDVLATAVPEVISVPPEFALEPTWARFAAAVMRAAPQLVVRRLDASKQRCNLHGRQNHSGGEWCP